MSPVNRRQACALAAVTPVSATTVEDITDRLAAINMSQSSDSDHRPGTCDTNPGPVAQQDLQVEGLDTPMSENSRSFHAGPTTIGEDCPLFIKGNVPLA